MDIAELLSQLMTLENIVLCLAIVALVWIQRKGTEVLTEYIGKKRGKTWDITKSKIWSEFLVPLGPLGTGMGIMLMPGVPIPEMFATGGPAKVIFGIFLGLISGLVYRMIKKTFFAKIGKEDEETEFLEE